MTAQEAFEAMLRDQHHPAKTIPANVTAHFGLLTQDDTSPPADRMPVWHSASSISNRSTDRVPSPAHRHQSAPGIGE